MRRTVGEVLDTLIERGFSPETIIDVGVATGTPDLYKRFPKAFYYFIEPLSHWQSAIESHQRRLSGVYYRCAAGDSDTTSRISVPKGARPGGANLIHTYSGRPVEMSEDVEVRRLDGLIDPSRLGQHAILKTDCQGYDARALIGAEGFWTT